MRTLAAVRPESFAAGPPTITKMIDTYSEVYEHQAQSYRESLSGPGAFAPTPFGSSAPVSALMDVNLRTFVVAFSRFDPLLGPIDFIDGPGAAYQSIHVPSGALGNMLNARGVITDTGNTCHRRPWVHHHRELRDHVLRRASAATAARNGASDVLLRDIVDELFAPSA